MYANIVQEILSLCSSIAIIGAAVVYIYNLIFRVKKPNKDRDEMLKRHSEMLDNDNRRLKEVEADNKIIMKSLLAIMSHELDGNHTEQLRQAKSELEEHLINR